MKRVFIVHGHDLQLRDEVTNYVRTLGLEPVILSDLANQGDTIIEKFERAASTSDYAIILLTGDDKGAANSVLMPLTTTEIAHLIRFYEMTKFPDRILWTKNTLKEDAEPIYQKTKQGILGAIAALSPRARQNVVLELGFFIGRLGRTRVCVLASHSVEPPSDIIGIATISTATDWKLALLKELQAAAML